MLKNLFPRRFSTRIACDLHRIDKAAAVDELTFATRNGVIKLGEVLRRHRQIRIQDHQDITGGQRESFSHGIAFPRSILHQQSDIPVGIGLHNTLDFFDRSVGRMTVHENNFLVSPEWWDPLHGGFDISPLIPTRNDDRGREDIRRFAHTWPRDNVWQRQSLFKRGRWAKNLLNSADKNGMRLPNRLSDHLLTQIDSDSSRWLERCQ
jgi:hypothetical protein